MVPLASLTWYINVTDRFFRGQVKKNDLPSSWLRRFLMVSKMILLLPLIFWPWIVLPWLWCHRRPWRLWKDVATVVHILTAFHHLLHYEIRSFVDLPGLKRHWYAPMLICYAYGAIRPSKDREYLIYAIQQHDTFIIVVLRDITLFMYLTDTALLPVISHWFASQPLSISWWIASYVCCLYI